MLKKIRSLVFKKVTRSKLDLLIKKYSSIKLTLDIGSASCPYKIFFPNIIRFDIEKNDGIDIVGDAHKLPFDDCSFDNILLTSVLGDCEDPYLVIQEVERVLKPGGKAILNVPFLYPINDAPNDYWRFTPFTLRKLFKNSCELEIIPVGGQMTTIALILQRISYQAKGSKLKRLFFALSARLIDLLNFDKFIIQEGYTTIDRKKGSEVDCFVTPMYFAVFQKNNLKI